ncbi:uncharacterized protein yc1106_05700 [Curvularia clavata]|uniref:F-box domain-containing protein n=1 Tax=Curvularia clavata TaxID=95742 RepID=A0A9Q9DUH0_CURCL|nr:uncharacterized protein yc1106_05700 [Curvularia clavata]
MTTYRRGTVYNSLISRLIPSSSAARRASKNYNLNLHNSPLYALPYELVQYIGTFLNYVDRFCFTLSSHKYADAILSIRPIGHQRVLTQEVICRLNRDHFYGQDHCLFSWIRRGLGQMYCVACSRQHNASRFPVETATQQRHLRKCFRTTDGPFYVCRHYEFTFQELASMLRRYKKKGQKNKHGHFFHCMECFDNAYATYGPGRGPLPPTLSLVPGTSIVTLRATFLLLSAPWTERVTIQDTHEALESINLKICPHINTSDTATIELILGGREETMMESRFSKRVSIGCNKCQTTLSIKRRIPFCEIMLEVDRKLGQVKWEGDPIWRAHLPRREY